MSSKISFDRKLQKKKLHKPLSKFKGGKSLDVKKRVVNNIFNNGSGNVNISEWNFMYAFLLFGIVFTLLIFSIAKLQIVDGEQMLKRSQNNSIRSTKVKAYRGVIFDSKGQKLVENVPSMNVYISLEPFILKEGGLDNIKLEKELDTLGGILEDSWERKSRSGESEYTSILERVFDIYDNDPYVNKILIATDIDNDIAIKIKASGGALEGISIDNDSKRRYIHGEIFTHVLGYTGEASESDIKYADISSGDIVGKSGVEII